MAQDDGTVLRGLLYEPLISDTHKDLTERFQALGMTEPGTAAPLTKAQRVESMLTSLTVEGLRQAAAAALTTVRVDASLRNALHDVLCDGQGPVIVERTRRTRRTLATAIDIDDLVVDTDRFEAMLDRWWVLGTPDPFAGLVADNDTASAFSFGPAGSTDRLRKDIRQHVFGNRDWSAAQLFEELGAFDVVDRRFAGFVEDLVSHPFVVDEDRQRRNRRGDDPGLARGWAGAA